MIDLDDLRRHLKYDPETGEFSWIRRYRNENGRSANALVLGVPLKNVSPSNGYVRIGFRGTRYLAHRLAWFYVHGRFPRFCIDHVNGDRADNRICNLREATRSQNLWNVPLKAANTSGYKGVSWDRTRNKFQAKVTVHGKQIHLGRFDSAAEAYQVYCAAAKKYHGDFARTA